MMSDLLHNQSLCLSLLSQCPICISYAHKNKKVGNTKTVETVLNAYKTAKASSSLHMCRLVKALSVLTENVSILRELQVLNKGPK